MCKHLSCPVLITSSVSSFFAPYQILARVGQVAYRLSLPATSRIHALVAWSGPSPELATWEDREALRQCFPFAPAWGQAGSPEVGSVRDAKVLDKQQEDIVTEGRGRRIRRKNPRVCGPEWM